MRQRVVIIGAGPAGLTAAWELAEAGVRDVTVLEATRAVGGLSQSGEDKGNRMDIGGHRLFSKAGWGVGGGARMLPLGGGPGPDAGGRELGPPFPGQPPRGN